MAFVKVHCISLLVLILGPTVFAGPVLEVVPLHLLFSQSSGNRHQFITIKNLSESQVGYVAISVYVAGQKTAWIGQSQKKTFSKSFGLIVAPRKLVIKPGLAKRVRVSYVGKFLPDRERIYDVVIRTISPPKQKSDQMQSGQRLGLKIQANISYATTVQVVPIKYHSKLSHKVLISPSGEHQLQLSNSGNISISLTHNVMCNAQKHCVPLANIFLLPGKSQNFQIPIKYNHFMSQQIVAGQHEAVDIALMSR